MSGCLARENPFRVERVHGLHYCLDEGSWTALLARLGELGHRAALVGPHGSGKSTLLAALEQRLEERGFRVRRLRLNERHRRPSPQEWRAVLAGAGARDVLTVDGAEQLGPWAWRRLHWKARSLGGLVITVHREGRLPTLRRHAPDPALLEDLVARLIGGGAARSLRPRLDQLFAAHAGNLRDCLRALYDDWGGEAAPRASSSAG